MNRQQRNDFIFQNTRRELSDNWDEKNKEHNCRYFFDQKEVCCQLFINTLGVKKPSHIHKLYVKCDKLNLNSNSLITAPVDQRCHNRGKRKHSLDFNNSLKNFINSKNPQKSHYDPNVSKLYIEN
jgi:hypothetical protein